MNSKAIVAFAGNTLRESLRDRILYGVLAFGVGLILLSAVLSNLTLGWQVRIVTDFSLSAITLAGSIMAILLGVSSVARELERKTAYPLLAKPISRASYVVGKYVGVLATVYLNVVLMMGAATVMIAAYSHEGLFQYPALPYLATLGLCLLRLAVIAAFAVLFSTFTSSTVAFIASLGMALSGYFSSELRFFLERSESAATQIIGKAIYWTVPDFAAIDTLPRLIHGHPIGFAQVGFSAAYAACYAAGLIVVAALIFSRRDLP